MDIADCYRVLGLTTTASAQEIKSSYRRLARQWHPDVNPDNQHAHDMFIRVTEAYKVLLRIVPTEVQTPAAPHSRSSPAAAPRHKPPGPRASSSPRPTPQSAQPNSAARPSQSERSASKSRPDPAYQVKLKAYEQLQRLLQMKRYPRAVASIEALSHKLPEDPEIRQWQAIIYHRWGRQLIAERKYNQARAYLKKASNTDPNNRSLLAEIEQDLRTIKMSV
ncbi:MAG: DnaJ domain-containing protein [Cyanobacteria bacterium P01_F01_bin.42]